MNKEENIYKHKFPIILWFSIISSAILIFLNVFRWYLVDLLTLFIEFFLEMVVYWLFFIILIWSLIFSILRFKKWGRKAILALLINLATLLIIFWIPFNKLTIDMDFKFNLDEREKIVEMIANKELVPNVPHNESLIQLPPQYENLSKGGGEVMVDYTDGLNIFFFTFRGILDNFSGFVYSENNSPLRNDFGCDYVELEKIMDHWFWMACI